MRVLPSSTSIGYGLPSFPQKSRATAKGRSLKQHCFALIQVGASNETDAATGRKLGQLAHRQDVELGQGLKKPVYDRDRRELGIR